LLIPSYGSFGAAFATLIAQAFTNLVTLAFFKKTRISSIMILKAFSPKYLFNLRKL
jgi:Na+-driven multidrug efflux pump